MAVTDLRTFLSGGVANTDPNLSLGGVKSTTRLYGQTPTYVSTTLAGVTLADSVGMVDGSSNIRLYFSTTEGFYIHDVDAGESGLWVAFDVDGEYVLETLAEDVSVTISVIGASLPGASQSNIQITTTTIVPNLFTNVTSEHSKTGQVTYRHFYIENISPINTYDLKVFLYQQLTGMDYLEIGFASVISGVEDELLTDEYTPPTGVVFNAPEDAISAVGLQMSSVSAIGVFLKRTVLALTDQSAPQSTAIISIGEYAP